MSATPQRPNPESRCAGLHGLVAIGKHVEVVVISTPPDRREAEARFRMRPDTAYTIPVRLGLPS
jgi:hypothetical protein